MNIKESKNIKKLKCTNSNVPYFTKDKIYNIYDVGFYILDDDGDKLFITYLETSEQTFKPIYEEIQTIKDTYNTPPHYQGSIQPIELINAQELNFNLGNVVKYVCRAGKKQGENTLSDLEKAKDYINFEIERVKKW